MILSYNEKIGHLRDKFDKVNQDLKDMIEKYDVAKKQWGKDSQSAIITEKNFRKLENDFQAMKLTFSKLPKSTQTMLHDKTPSIAEKLEIPF